MQDHATIINTDMVFDEPEMLSSLRAQYHFRDFSFWTSKALDRSVSRFQYRLADAHAPVGEVLVETPLDDEDANRDDDPVLHLPAVFQARIIGEKSVNTLQEWDCVVDEVTDAEVIARARSLIYPREGEDQMRVPLQEFQPSDRSRLRPGVVFRLIIGYTRKPSGSRTREAIIYIRNHLPQRLRDLESSLSLLEDG